MKILIVSNSPWRDDNSFGNSFSNIFDGLHEEIEIANIYLKYGTPNCTIVKKFFQITEGSLLRNLLYPKLPTGKQIFRSEIYDSDLKEKKTFDKARKFKGTLLVWVRTFIWKIGRWKSSELEKFVEDFAPDMLFIPIYYSHYIHDVNFWIKNKCNIPAVGYISDDNYSLRRISCNLFFWLDRILMRKRLRKVFNACDIVYTISEVQKEYLSCRFGDKFKILTKYANFDEESKPSYQDAQTPIRMLYTGNLGNGRYDSLRLLAKALSQLNGNIPRIILDIYTSTILTKRQRTDLGIGYTTLHDAVGFDKVLILQEQADILVHVEGLKLKDRLDVAQSFSTKIVDYLQRRKPIFVVGKSDCASVKYFLDNESGIVAQNSYEIMQKLIMIVNSPKILFEYADKAWQCGVVNHQKQIHQNKLKKDLLAVGLKRN